MYQLLILLSDIVYVYTLTLVIYALLSWFPGGYQSGFGRFLSKICDPYLSIFDRLNLTIGPVDFKVAFAIIVLNLASQGLFQMINLVIK